METKDLILISIALVSALVAVSSYLLNRRVFIGFHDLNRRQNALRLIERWDEATLDARKAVMSIWPESFHETKDIPWNEIEQERERQIGSLKKGGQLDSGTRLITDHMNTIMNYLELIAVAAYNNVADEEILSQSYDVPFDRWYRILSDFREHVSKHRKYNPWKPVDKLHEKWYETPHKQKPQIG
ncbi:MAG: hypothetical protein ABSF91_05865 [Bacteroidota bacterium]|jgi:hypothetical protein